MAGLGSELAGLSGRGWSRAVAALVLTAAGAVACGSSEPSGPSTAQCRAAVPKPASARSIAAGPPVVPAHGAYLGAFALNGTVFTQEQYIASTAELEVAICHPIAIVHSYLQWAKPFPTDSQLATVKAGQMLLISWTGTDLATMASGADDAEIRDVAAEVASLRAPVFLELRWEMDRPNLASVVHGPATFIAAWDHTRQIFAAAGVTNASWVWCPTATGFERGTAQQYYPGAAEVDWICADAYPDPVGPEEQLSHEISSFLAWARSQGKPLMLGEIGVPESYPSDVRAQWITNAAEFIRKTPQIKAAVYFDYNPVGHSSNRDYAIGPGSPAAEALRQVASDPWFNPSKPTAVRSP